MPGETINQDQQGGGNTEWEDAMQYPDRVEDVEKARAMAEAEDPHRMGAIEERDKLKDFLGKSEEEQAEIAPENEYGDADLSAHENYVRERVAEAKEHLENAAKAAEDAASNYDLEKQGEELEKKIQENKENYGQSALDDINKAINN